MGNPATGGAEAPRSDIAACPAGAALSRLLRPAGAALSRLLRPAGAALSRLLRPVGAALSRLLRPVGAVLKTAPFLAAALCAAALSGCALFQGKTLTEVNDSQLNWLTVRYHPATPGAKPCCLEIVGVGSVEFRQGRSPLVFNSFSQDVDNPLWGDIIEEKLGVTPEQARWMMQLFVDAGLTTEAKRMRKLSSKELNDASAGIAAISAKLNGELFRVRTNNPEITGVVDSIIEAVVSNRGFR